MESIIKKAIEGGWTPREFTKNHVLNVGNRTFIIDDSPFFDPLFWQALGKECGWEDKHEDFYCDECADWEVKTNKMWISKALRFHEINLTEGWEKAVEYLKEVTK